MGDLYRALGLGERARAAYEQGLAIRERLAAAEPDRADYQRDLSISYTRLASLHEAAGERAEALNWYRRDLAIAESLAAAEPARADLQVDLAISLYTTSRVAGDDTPALLARGAAILRSLDGEGRLPPDRRSLLQAIERALTALA